MPRWFVLLVLGFTAQKHKKSRHKAAPTIGEVV